MSRAPNYIAHLLGIPIRVWRGEIAIEGDRRCQRRERPSSSRVYEMNCSTCGQRIPEPRPRSPTSWTEGAATPTRSLASLSRSHSYRASIATKGVRADDSSAGVSIPQPSSIDRAPTSNATSIPAASTSRSHSHRASIATSSEGRLRRMEEKSRFHSHRASIATNYARERWVQVVSSRFHSHRASIATPFPGLRGSYRAQVSIPQPSSIDRDAARSGSVSVLFDG